MVLGFFTYPKRLNDLFCDAVNVWLILGDEDALEIAANAVLTAGRKQRETMVHYAATAIEPIKHISEGIGAIPTSVLDGHTVELGVVERRLEILLGKFEEMSGISLMQARKAMKPENRAAVWKAETTFFRFRYPDFPLWGRVPETMS